MKACKTCVHWDEFFPGHNDWPDEDRMGSCKWTAEGGLPEAWRYTGYEVTAMQADGGTNCPQHEGYEV